MVGEFGCFVSLTWNVGGCKFSARGKGTYCGGEADSGKSKSLEFLVELRRYEKSLDLL